MLFQTYTLDRTATGILTCSEVSSCVAVWSHTGLHKTSANFYRLFHMHFPKKLAFYLDLKLGALCF
jgi:hypothetical protein